MNHRKHTDVRLMVSFRIRPVFGGQPKVLVDFRIFLLPKNLEFDFWQLGCKAVQWQLPSKERKRPCITSIHIVRFECCIHSVTLTPIRLL
jgi:hypothetical protein